MKIFEVTQIKEAAPGSFAAKAGVFGRALAGALSQKAFGVDPNQFRNQATVDPNEIAPAIKATVNKVAQQMAQTWPQSVLAVMQQSPTAGGGKGVTSFAKINKPLLMAELTRQTDTLVRSLTGNRYNSMDDLLKVDVANVSADAQKLTKARQDIIQKSFAALQRVDPSTKPDYVLDLWGKIINSVMGLAKTQVGSGDPEESKLRQSKVTKDATGKIAVNGRILDMTNTADQQTMIKLQTLGLLP